MKFDWERVDRPGHWLRLKISNEYDHRKLDEQIAAIVRWSEATKCGRRMAYDMWQFREESHMTQFVLKWA